MRTMSGVGGHGHVRGGVGEVGDAKGSHRGNFLKNIFLKKY